MAWMCAFPLTTCEAKQNLKAGMVFVPTLVSTEFVTATGPKNVRTTNQLAARNHMRNMNAGDKAFFYHSNCKEPGIAGIMEIVKEFSDDRKKSILFHRTTCIQDY